MHHQHPAGKGLAGPRGKAVGNGGAAGKGERHALRLPHPALGAGEKLPLLRRARPATGRRREQPECRAAGGSGRDYGSTLERQPDDLQAKGCHSGNP